MPKKKKLTREEAIHQLVETRTISTSMLEPLGYTFESFLRFAQLPKSRAEELIDQLIEFYSGDKAKQDQMIREARETIATSKNTQ